MENFKAGGITRVKMMVKFGQSAIDRHGRSVKLVMGERVYSTVLNAKCV